ncbi:uncharacterized protein LOC134710884 [Mytilus trossulus]|uniref:uncharacterized protein LOC134710884 n=1 Tax=Mytilus trossulus TaxID=6551 RepID=UPI003007AF16
MYAATKNTGCVCYCSNQQPSTVANKSLAYCLPTPTCSPTSTICGGTDETKVLVYSINGGTTAYFSTPIKSTVVTDQSTISPTSKHISIVTTTLKPTTVQVTSKYWPLASTSHETLRATVVNSRDTSTGWITKNQDTDTTSIAAYKSNQCQCSCKLKSNKWFQLEKSVSRDRFRIILQNYIFELQKNITVEVKETSSYWNKKRSAQDNRKSCCIMGWTACLILAFPFALVLFSDLMNIYRP